VGRAVLATFLRRQGLTLPMKAAQQSCSERCSRSSASVYPRAPPNRLAPPMSCVDVDNFIQSWEHAAEGLYSILPRPERCHDLPSYQSLAGGRPSRELLWVVYRRPSLRAPGQDGKRSLDKVPPRDPTGLLETFNPLCDGKAPPEVLLALSCAATGGDRSPAARGTSLFTPRGAENGYGLC
jgi:hypothetical protein